MLQEREILFNRVPREELPDFFHAAWDHSEKNGDTVQWEVLANSPVAAQWFADSYRMLYYSGTVDQRLKLLVRCRLARSNGCAMCSAMNTEAMLAEGFTPDAVDAVTAWPEPFVPEPFSPIEIAVLNYTDQIVAANLNGALDAELYTELRQFFDDAEIVELGMLMSFFTGTSKWMMAADLMPKLASCPLPGAAGVDPTLHIVPAPRVEPQPVSSNGSNTNAPTYFTSTSSNPAS